MVQPLAALLVILIGWRSHESYPAGDPAETVLLVALALVTLPGLVVAVVDAVQRSRRTQKGQRPGYQRMLDAAAPRGDTPALPPSLAGDVAARVLGWGTAQAGLSLALALLLIPLPLEEGWSTLAVFPVLVALVVACLVLLGGIVWLGVKVLLLALVPGGRHPMVEVPAAPEEMNQRKPLVFRALLVALGVSLLGLATFGLPWSALTWDDDVHLSRGIGSLLALGAYAVQADGAATGWIWALRVTVGMMLGGLAGVLVLSPVALWQMVIRPRRKAQVPE